MADRSPRADTHRLTVCTTCRYQGTWCRPGHDLIARLREAIDAAGDLLGADFEVAGTACMAGCERPCTVAYQASRKATYLFGDIDPDQDVEDLVAFAKQYAALEDGWSAASERPPGLSAKTLARVPAAIMVAGAAGAGLQ